MKNLKPIRVIALILVLVMTVPCFISCQTSSDTDPTETTASDVVNPPVTTVHKHSYGDAKVTKEPTCTDKGQTTATCECGATDVKEVDALGHTYENGKCKTCGAIEIHEHVFTNNKCSCGAVGFNTTDNNFGIVGMVEKDSQFDGNQDNSKDKFYFAPTLADKFTAAGAITVVSTEYDKTLSKNPTSNLTSYPNLPHYYITENTSQTLVYKITVTEEGVYDVVIHMRLKDTKERGNKFTVNPDTNSAYTFETSFKPASNDEIASMKTSDGNDSTYMYGMQIYLNAGDNYIKIEASSTEKCQHFRHFYFAKATA
jgi:hypothetical protein